MGERIRRGGGGGAIAAACAGFVLALALAAAPASAQQSWVKDEVRLNIRSGPSHQNRIVATVRTGDAVTILERGDGWTRVRGPDGKEGWVPAGFLVSQAPAAVRVTALEEELAALKGRLSQATDEAAGLRTDHEQAAAREGEQQALLDALKAENMELKAGARWPYLLWGAAILAAGMVAGAVLRSPRRRAGRIRI